MESFLIKAAQLVAALSLLVLVHEFGHYIFARMFKIRVEKFYLFFNPWFSLLQYDPAKGTLRLGTWSKPDPHDANVEIQRQLVTIKVGRDRSGDKHMPRWRETIYGIGWLPLGGYCKIAGMIDESMDREQMARPAQDWEFRSRPAYQRLLVMIGGVLFNFLLAILIYAGIALHWGQQYIPFDKATEGMAYVDAAKKVGFADGDIPLLADGEKIDITDPQHMEKMVEADTVKVLRNHTDTVAIAIPDDFLFRLNDDKGFFTFRQPVYVDKLMSGEPAVKAGIQPGDHLVAVDTVATPSYTEFTSALSAYAGKTTKITVDRDGQQIAFDITPSPEGKIGIQLRPITDIYPVVVKRFSLLESIPQGWEIGTARLSSYVNSMKYVATAEGAKSLGGFGALGSMFPDKWNWYSFWNIAAFLSVALAFMNILPIPALDGGHVMFTLYEIIARRKPSDKFMEYAQICGMVFLFLLLVYANGNDIYRFFIK